MRMAEPSSGMIDTAGENCITRLDGAVGARRTTQSKTTSANPIAVTESVCEWRPSTAASSLCGYSATREQAMADFKRAVLKRLGRAKQSRNQSAQSRQVSVSAAKPTVPSTAS